MAAKTFRSIVAGFMLTAFYTLANAAGADDFRIESSVYEGKNKEPVSESMTLFRAGIVYDCLTDPPRVAVFDQPRGRFVLLDIKNKRKTEISTRDLVEFSHEVQSWTTSETNPLLKFALNPTFALDTAREPTELVFRAEPMTYRVTTEKSETAEAARQYREFSDWYVRLNALTTPGSAPSLARLAVNDELAKRSLLPRSVELTIAAQGPLKRPVIFRSEHRIYWRLLQSDQDKIALIGQQMATFPAVKLGELHQTAKR